MIESDHAPQNPRRADSRQIIMAARVHGLEALSVLVSIMQDPTEDAGDRVRAADKVLERGYGKAPLLIHLNDGADANDLAIMIPKAMGVILGDMTNLDRIHETLRVADARVVEPGGAGIDDRQAEPGPTE